MAGDVDDEMPKPSDEKVRFGKRLRAKRQLLGLSQPEIFERTGIAVSYISHVENANTNPSLDVMVRLADAVGETLADMLKP